MREVLAAGVQVLGLLSYPASGALSYRSKLLANKSPYKQFTIEPTKFCSCCFSSFLNLRFQNTLSLSLSFVKSNESKRRRQYLISNSLTHSFF